MKHMAMRSIRKIWKTTSHWLMQGNGNCVVFEGSTKNFVENGAIALQESVSLFNGKTKPIRYLSIDELNAMNLEPCTMCAALGVKWYKGLWDGNWVLVKEHSGMFYPELRSATFREIMVSAQMSTHKNVHKLLGCCIETKYVVLVYEYVENVTLHDLILEDKPSFGWKQRLKIAWEISHALAYLHTGFQRPIVHRSINPQNVYFGKDYAAKLSNFSYTISIPEGKEYVEAVLVGTSGYIAPESLESFKSTKVAESVDVYAFGVLLLVLLTGKDVTGLGRLANNKHIYLREWVEKHFENNPAITGDALHNNEEAEHQLRASISLALKCTAIENNTRPTIEVATELKSMIEASGYIPN